MYSWTSSDNEPWLLTRHLTALECMFVILNEKLYGQNCPFMGLSISVRSEEKSGGSLSFKLQHLQTGATKAFCQTRWKYPTIASRILDGNRASYNIESRSEVKSWANRALSIVHYDQGWQSFMERQSRDCSLPSPEGDVCALHLILPLENARGSELQSFDILIRIHHAFADGSGIRAILNEFLHRLTDPLSDEELRWGEEVSRLLPGASILGKVEVSEEETLVKAPDEMALSSKSSAGLPVYRPDILSPKPEHRGTVFVSHTFSSPDFLPTLKAACRQHHVKLTSVLHTALLKAVYEVSPTEPSPEDIYQSDSLLDLRNGYLLPEYCDRGKYVNQASAIQQITAPCSLFGPDRYNGEEPFWRAAQCISDQWETIKMKKDLAKTAQSDAKKLIDALKGSISTKLKTCPYYSSDPPGSQELRAIYPIAGSEPSSLTIDSYQMASEQMQERVSARSHSWNDLLTLTLAFNAVRVPKEKMQEFLEKWTANVAEAAKSGESQV